MSRKAVHLIAETNENRTRFSVCGRVSSENDRINNKGAIIVSSIPFNDSDDKCLKCYWARKALADESRGGG